MTFNLTEDLCYFVDKGIYEQKMAIENMIFMLSKHLDDKDEEFLQSKLFEKLNDKVIEKTAARWYRENEAVKQFVESFNNYEMDLSRGILFVEMK